MSVRVGRRPQDGFYGLVVQNGPWAGPIGNGKYKPDNKEIIRPYAVKSSGYVPLSVVAQRVVKDEPVLISNSGTREDVYAKYLKKYPHALGKFATNTGLTVGTQTEGQTLGGGASQSSVGTDMLDLPSMPTDAIDMEIGDAPFEEVIDEYLSELAEVVDEETPQSLTTFVTNQRWAQRLASGIMDGSPSALRLFGAAMRSYIENTRLTREAIALGGEGVTLYLTPEPFRPLVRNVIQTIRTGRDISDLASAGVSQAAIQGMREIFDRIEGYALGGSRTLPDFDMATSTLDFGNGVEGEMRFGVLNLINTIFLLLASLGPGQGQLRRQITGVTRSGATFRPQIMPGSL